jgi:hypothetical protein
MAVSVERVASGLWECCMAGREKAGKRVPNLAGNKILKLFTLASLGDWTNQSFAYENGKALSSRGVTLPEEPSSFRNVYHCSDPVSCNLPGIQLTMCWRHSAGLPWREALKCIADKTLDSLSVAIIFRSHILISAT